ncbi:MAG: anhydro-N-acetylmuramic acid kinase [Flavobacteriales bacterium]|nr:anhydro-N-acetylmuramic acid kinase [Flavobacteriales bacterium]MCB9177878.1 anhydro-N-acetylmuramic acid kinase [Flavobacteriales bacterium]
MAAPDEVHYTAIGVMSGSSLDGLDLALCHFTLRGGRWSFTLDDARTIPYEPAFQQKLVAVMNGSALELARLDRDLGDLIGRAVLDFLQGRHVDLIASHGHTVFHQPVEGLTVQIGHGARIAAITGVRTITDFRTLDVALGGQGAPLVPLGEQLLFPDQRAFLNIGGICNISVHDGARVLGYDVCIGNQALNLLAEEAGKSFDDDGALARSGQVDAALLDRLNAIPFHRQPPPRSLGREWFDAGVRALITDELITLKDRSRTVVEHIAMMVAEAIPAGIEDMLVTGGGAHNGFLMERIQALNKAHITIPRKRIVDYKEALIFAFLGVRRLRGEVTALASVTGARLEASGGSIFL